MLKWVVIAAIVAIVLYAIVVFNRLTRHATWCARAGAASTCSCGGAPTSFPIWSRR